MSCAGRFECEHCPAYHTALLKYCLLILAIVAINAILIWELGTASSTGSSWNEPEGADYVDVGIYYNIKQHVCVLSCGTSAFAFSLKKHARPPHAYKYSATLSFGQLQACLSTAAHDVSQGKVVNVTAPMSVRVHALGKEC